MEEDYNLLQQRLVGEIGITVIKLRRDIENDELGKNVLNETELTKYKTFEEVFPVKKKRIKTLNLIPRKFSKENICVIINIFTVCSGFI